MRQDVEDEADDLDRVALDRVEHPPIPDQLDAPEVLDVILSRNEPFRDAIAVIRVLLKVDILCIPLNNFFPFKVSKSIEITQNQEIC